MMKQRPPKDPLKAARKGSREAEIGMYDHPLPKHKVHKSKRQYSRKNTKVRLNNEGEPLFLPILQSIPKNYANFTVM